MQLLNNQLLTTISRFGLGVAIVASTLVGQTDAQVRSQLTDQQSVSAITGTVDTLITERPAQMIHHYALDQAGNLTGQITVTGDKPSNLGVYALQNNVVVYQATTNSMGEFTIATIKPGRYSLVIAGRNQLAAQGIMIEQNATPATQDFIQLSTIQTTYKGVQDLVATALPKEIATNLGSAISGTQKVSVTLSDAPIAKRVRIINGNIKGQIVSLINDDNIAGTTIHLLQNSKPVAQVEIDDEGMFTIPDAEAGIYDLVATADAGMAAMRFEAIGMDNPMKMVSFSQQIPTQLSIPLAEDCPCNQVQIDQPVPINEPAAMEAASHSPVEYASESIGCGGSCGGCCGATGNFAGSTGHVLGSRGAGGGFIGGGTGGFAGGASGFAGSAGGFAGSGGLTRLLTLASLGGAITALADDDDGPASNASN